jgi:hypothetical protein
VRNRRDPTRSLPSRRPIFNATLWAAASWLFSRPAAAMAAGGLDPYESRYGCFVTASPARTALKNSQLIRRPPGDRRTTSPFYERRYTRLLPIVKI